MVEIVKNGVLYAIFDQIETTKPGSTWYGSPDEFIQVSKVRQIEGKQYDAHRHKVHERIVKQTQEVIIVIRGSLKAFIYDDSGEMLQDVLLSPHDILILYRGYHFLVVREDDTVFYEIKSGQFMSVEKDKEYL